MANEVDHLCPKCGGPMVSKMARRGPNAGNQFLSCSRYPQCKGTRDLSGNSPTPARAKADRIGLHWPDPERGPWAERFFLPVSAVGTVEGDVYKRSLRWNHGCVALPDLPRTPLRDPKVRTVLSVAMRVLMRGEAPPLPVATVAALAQSPPPSFPSRLSAGPPVAGSGPARLLALLAARIDPALRPFLQSAVPLANLGVGDPAAGDCADAALIVSCDPERAIVIDLESGGGSRPNREDVLAAAGFSYFLIPEAELRDGGGATFDRFQAAAEALPPLLAQAPEPVAVAQVAATLVYLIQAGCLKPAAPIWNLGLVGPFTGALAEGLAFARRLLAALDQLFGATTLPGEFRVTSSGEEAAEPDLVFDWDVSPWFHEPPDQPARVVSIRPTWLPAMPPLPPPPLDWVGPRPEVPSEALRELLQVLFPGKTDFWEGQEEGLRRCLTGEDCLVLLPTGRGKSLIYQMGALLLPGLTLIVAPLVALMDDQVDNLRRAGIDRVVAITRATTRSGMTENTHDLLRAGVFIMCYIAPERLQIEQFRSALATVREVMPIPLVVVDEAHCVSEWGHDFRPAYLNLARAARQFGRRAEGTPPAIVGLTGTASRAVLRDLQNALAITEYDAVITPTDFHRPELTLETVRAPSNRKGAALEGIIRALPDRLGVRSGELLAPRERNRISGIVFCPHATGPFGVVDVAQYLGEKFTIFIPTYSGQNTDEERKVVSRGFKNDAFGLLVATKAFGMGIDKPNVRYTVHYGMPPSLEAFYQEAGRAGRDRAPAHCVLIASVDDEARAATILAPDCSLEQVRGAQNKGEARDDIDRSLFFHLKNFKGVEEDAERLDRLLRFLEPLDSGGNQILSFESDEEQKELEQGLHRLIVLSVVSDYTVDYGRKKIELTKRPFRSGDAVRAGRAYVAGYSQSRARKLFPAQMEQSFPSARDEVLHGVRTLIHFIYGTIELSRRTAIRSVWRWAQDGGKNNRRLWEILLNYLTETEFSAAVSQILREEEHSLSRWSELLEQVASRRDLEELYGGLDRAQSDFPDHPAVLAMRSIVAAIRHETGDAAQYAGACLRYLRERYTADPQLVQAYGEWIVAQVRHHQRRLLSPVVMKVVAEDDGSLCRSLAKTLAGDPAENALVPKMLRLLTADLRRLIDQHGGEELIHA